MSGDRLAASGQIEPRSPDRMAIPWEAIPAELRRRGLRWTPQRRVLVDVLRDTKGHVTGSEVVERCRERDSLTIASTVYRTLDVLEEIGIVRHHHAADGREQYHVLPHHEHGHVHCSACGRTWELDAEETSSFAAHLRRTRDFELDLGHMTVAGRCAACRQIDRET